MPLTHGAISGGIKRFWLPVATPFIRSHVTSFPATPKQIKTWLGKTTITTVIFSLFWRSIVVRVHPVLFSHFKLNNKVMTNNVKGGSMSIVL